MAHLLRKLSIAAACAVVIASGNSAQAADIVTKVVDYGSVDLPFSRIYGTTFNAPQALGDVFFENYAFTIADGSFNSVTANFNLANFLSISNVQARLFAGAPGVVGSAPVSAPTIVQAWSSPVSGGLGTINVIDRTSLSAGSYVLEVRGTVTGSSGGSYSGLLNVTPVPEADGIALALAGFGVLGFVRARRKS